MYKKKVLQLGEGVVELFLLSLKNPKNETVVIRHRSFGI